MDFSEKQVERSAFEAQDAVLGFDGPTRFLSNFAASEVEMYGIIFPTVEHAFAAAKLDPNGGVHDRATVMKEMRAIAAAPAPGDAKRLGRRRTLNGKPFMRADGDAKKEELVLELLRRKFADPKLAEKLRATGSRPLVELNTWGDRIWGMTEQDGVLEGRNMLGEMLMQVRSELAA